MHTFSRVVILAFILSVITFAQTPGDPFTFRFPTWVAGGITQDTAGHKSLFVSAIYPMSNSDTGITAAHNLYTSSTLNLTPVKTSAGYAFREVVKQGIHKLVYSKSKFLLFVGAEPGAAIGKDGSDTTVTFAGSFTATPAYMFRSNLGLVLPTRAEYQNGIGWAFAPSIGVVFRP